MSVAPLAGLVPVFDLDGTLLDSDPAIVAAFASLGVPAAELRFGPLLAVECARLGVEPAAYLAAYDATLAVPYPGVDEALARLSRWALCSNKEGANGREAVRRAAWTPEVALFADAFGGPKRLEPVLDALGVGPDRIAFVGDTSHDAACAEAVGCPFVVAGWNPRTTGLGGDVVAERPADLLGLFGLA